MRFESWLDLCGSGQGQVLGSWDHGNEPVGSLKCWKNFLANWRTVSFSRLTPWSYLITYIVQPFLTERGINFGWWFKKNILHLYIARYTRIYCQVHIDRFVSFWNFLLLAVSYDESGKRETVSTTCNECCTNRTANYSEAVTTSLLSLDSTRTAL